VQNLVTVLVLLYCWLRWSNSFLFCFHVCNVRLFSTVKKWEQCLISKDKKTVTPCVNSGAVVMITIFDDFCQFAAKKNWGFLKKKLWSFFARTGRSLCRKPSFFRHFVRREYFQNRSIGTRFGGTYERNCWTLILRSHSNVDFKRWNISFLYKVLIREVMLPKWFEHFFFRKI
jgi:hypothetical protein